MKSFSLASLIILMLIVSFLPIKKYLHLNLSKDSKNENKTQLKESVRILNECFDLENKYKRPLHKSIELIEFCIDEYRYKKQF